MTIIYDRPKNFNRFFYGWAHHLTHSTTHPHLISSTTKPRRSLVGGEDPADRFGTPVHPVSRDFSEIDKLMEEWEEAIQECRKARKGE